MSVPRGSVFALRLGAFLQQSRQRRGLTQAAASERAGLAEKYLGEIERGEAAPSFRVLEQLATVLEWDPAPETPLVMPRRRGRPKKDGTEAAHEPHA